MGSKKSGIIMACIGGIASLIGFIMLFSGFADVGAWFAGLGLIALILGIRISKDADKEQDAKELFSLVEEVKDVAEFRKGILYLKKRDERLRRIITIEDHYTTKLKYNPETLHYGSVTVGGVTTGGVYKTGGDYTSITKKSGMKLMCYNGHGIIDIELSDALCNQAKTSYISKYLDGNRIQVMGRGFMLPYTPASTAEAYSPKFMEQIEIDKELGIPYEKCIDILNWICSKANILREPTAANEWKCPKCGKINQHYVGTCGCGKLKPQ